jgi:hypothetical protein
VQVYLLSYGGIKPQPKRLLQVWVGVTVPLPYPLLRVKSSLLITTSFNPPVHRGKTQLPPRLRGGLGWGSSYLYKIGMLPKGRGMICINNHKEK